MTLRRIMVLLLAAVGAVAIIGIGAYEFIAATESSAFCGRVCHTPMSPEYTTYQASPHSIVECSSCHVGAGSYNLITSKARGIPQIYQTLTGNYERPIPSPVENLRPARETCEQCHTPSKFTGFLLRTSASFRTDETNTKETNTIVLEVGGGTSGAASGIHWHTAAEVWYLPMDDQRLEIGWIGVEKDGAFTEYIDPSAVDGITPQRIEAEKRLMDCVDCHNRASHIFRSPNDLINRAMNEGRIDSTIPYIKREALNAIGSPQPSLEEAYSRVEAVSDFYADAYPDFYAGNREKIEQATSELKEIARLTTFPVMQVDWNTHADHSGHNEPPEEMLAELNITFDNWRTNKSEGCFRCHGKLVPATVTQSAVVIPEPDRKMDAGCNLCHYSLTAGPGSPVPMAMPHPTEGLENCLLCHGPSTLKPIPEDHPWTNNEACTYCHEPPEGDINIPHPPVTLALNIPHTSSGLEDCLLCHEPGAPVPISADHPWSNNETCNACHKPAAELLPLPAAAPPGPDIPEIPHSVRGLEDCLLCHGPASPQPFQTDHPWTTNETCSSCHETAPSLLPLPAALPPEDAPEITHNTSGLEECLLCHGPNAPRPFTVAHPWTTNETCSSCHETAAQVIPVPPSVNLASQIPHSIQGLSDCRLCHSASGTVPYPADHGSIPTSFCTLCHQPGG